MDVVAEIKSRLDIVELLGGYLELKKAGRNFKACCPFHAEKTPSFVISPERQFAWCYGCQNGGDIFSLVQKLEGIEFREALVLLAEKAGVELPDRTPAATGAAEKKTRLKEINAAAADFFRRQLAEDTAAQTYLARRGLSNKTIEKWGVGFAPDASNLLSQELLAAGYTAAEISEAGVAGLRELGGTEMYDRFRGRVVWPLRDARGITVGFTGRVLADNAKTAKYLNSPESPIFTKGALLFGLDVAGPSIRETGRAIVVEGQMDVLACHQAGYANVVATSGTALTEHHLRTLARLADTVVFCFDADHAGIESAKRALALALPLDLSIKILRLPGNCKDPDEALQTAPTEFAAAVAKPLGILDWYFAVALADVDLHDFDAKKKAARELLQLAAHFASPLAREDFLRQLAHRLGVSEAALTAEFQLQKPVRPASHAKTDAPLAATEPTRAELLTGLLLAFPAVAADFIAHVQPALPAELAQLLPNGADENAEKLRLWALDRYGEFGERPLKQEIKALLIGMQKRVATNNKHALLIELTAAEAAGDGARAAELLAEYQKLL